MQNLSAAVGQRQSFMDEEVIDLRAYWRVLKLHRLKIIGLGVMFALVSILVVFSMTPIYKSSAELLIEPNSSNVVSIEEVYGLAGSDIEYYTTQYAILKSRVLVEQVIDRLSLAEHPEFLADDGGFLQGVKNSIKEMFPSSAPVSKDIENEAKLHGLIENFLGRLEVSPIRKSHLVTISFEANDRHLASQVVNTLAELYIKNDLDSRMQMTGTATVWLTERLSDLKNNLKESEEKLQAYREREKLIDIGGVVTTVTAQQLTDLGQKLASAKQETAVARSSLYQIRSLKDKSTESLLSIPIVLQDMLVSSLREEESSASRNLKSFSKRYGPMHPQMKQAEAELASARLAVKRRVAQVISGVEKSYQVARANERSLVGSISSTKNEMQNINRKGYQLSVFERDVDSNRQLYDMFLNRLKETSETTGLDRAHARVSDPAVPSVTPVKPKKKLIVIIAAFMGLFMGVLLAFLLEHLDSTLKKGADLEEELGLPILGVLPLLALKKAQTGEKAITPLSYSLENPKSFFVESIRTVRTGVLLSGLDNPHKIIVVTSSVPGEGKSTVSINLASSMSELNRVLLIDADMRRPTVAKTWGLEEGSKGLSEFIAHEEDLQNCIHRAGDTKHQLYVMPSGMVPPNPLELLSSKLFAKGLESLATKFDHIVIDSAPALAVSDSLLLSSLASGVVYVVRADETPIDAAKEGVKRLLMHDAHLIGGVLNGVQQKDKGSYYGGDYYGSYGYSD